MKKKEPSRLTVLFILMVVVTTTTFCCCKDKPLPPSFIRFCAFLGKKNHLE